MKTKIKVTDPKKEERIAERIFTVQSAYALLWVVQQIILATTFMTLLNKPAQITSTS
jgi:hypothetical protein